MRDKITDKGFRGVLVFDRTKQKLVPKEQYKAPYKTPTAAAVITDEIEPTLSHASTEGRIFTSKSKLRQHYKENGCIEVGKWTPSKATKQEIDERALKDAAEKAFYDLKYDRVQLTEEEKELCRREEREYQAYLKRNGR